MGRYLREMPCEELARLHRVACLNELLDAWKRAVEYIAYWNDPSHEDLEYASIWERVKTYVEWRLGYVPK